MESPSESSSGGLVIYIYVDALLPTLPLAMMLVAWI
jgi:hypothetical protein